MRRAPPIPTPRWRAAEDVRACATGHAATIGFNCECIEYRKMVLSCWDVSGMADMRPFWRLYYADTQAVVFVVDSSDAARMDEAREDLHRLLTEHELWDAPLLVLANKQDLPSALSMREITERLQARAERARCSTPPRAAGCTRQTHPARAALPAVEPQLVHRRHARNAQRHCGQQPARGARLGRRDVGHARGHAAGLRPRPKPTPSPRMASAVRSASRRVQEKARLDHNERTKARNAEHAKKKKGPRASHQ